jgi:uncharacterized protein YbjQ (UPF0145 family)
MPNKVRAKDRVRDRAKDRVKDRVRAKDRAKVRAKDKAKARVRAKARAPGAAVVVAVRAPGDRVGQARLGEAPVLGAWARGAAITIPPEIPRAARYSIRSKVVLETRSAWR